MRIGCIQSKQRAGGVQPGGREGGRKENRAHLFKPDGVYVLPSDAEVHESQEHSAADAAAPAIAVAECSSRRLPERNRLVFVLGSRCALAHATPRRKAGATYERLPLPGMIGRVRCLRCPLLG